jgi:hypothetical protein
MIIRSTINSPCDGRMYYLYKSMGKQQREYLPKSKTRLSEYNTDLMIQELQKDSSVKNIYVYKVKYDDGQISILANPNYPIDGLYCEDDDDKFKP